MSVMDDMVINVLQKMTGLSPDQMQDLSNRAIDLLQNVSDDMAQIKNDLAAIKSVLNIGKVIEHDPSDRNND